MKQSFFLFFGSILLSHCQPSPPSDPIIITQDIAYFWEAYDSIQSTADTLQQRAFLQELYLDRGSQGLTSLLAVRRYTAEEYLQAIRNYPKYWASIRPFTLQADQYAEEIHRGIQGFAGIYPDYRPAKVYFEIGAFRTPGTAIDSVVLIGAELAMGNDQVITEELPPNLDYVRQYLRQNPSENLGFLNVHEYVHTQQNAIGGYDLLSQSLFEGVPEFVATLAMDQASPTPAIAYGASHETEVKAIFEREMFSPWFYRWIWNDTLNEFGVRDLGYYVGYAMAQRFYEKSADKQAAIKSMIELDYQDSLAVAAFADKSGYFTRPIDSLKRAYQSNRPVVAQIDPPILNDRGMDPATRQITFTFSEPMDTRFRSTDLGPMGKAGIPEIKGFSWAADGRSITYEVNLDPGTTYQFVLASGYRNLQAIPLQPQLISFTTGH